MTGPRAITGSVHRYLSMSKEERRLAPMLTESQAAVYAKYAAIRAGTWVPAACATYTMPGRVYRAAFDALIRKGLLREASRGIWELTGKDGEA